MRPTFFIFLFLSSFSFSQELTKEEMAAATQEELACSSDFTPVKGTVIDRNSGTPLGGAKIVVTTNALGLYSSEVKEFTSDNNGKFDFGNMGICDTLTVSMDGYITITAQDNPVIENYTSFDGNEWTIELAAGNDGGNNPSQVANAPQQNVPANLESGYKGFAWGAPAGSNISNNFNSLPTTDSTTTTRSFTGNLGLDSVVVAYAFADSGFWKVEIDFVVKNIDLDFQIADFRRLEKNISAVYGPPNKMNQQESGPSGSYSNILEQKYARAFYRSSWSVTPVVIELFLNSSVLVPVTDLPIFSGNFVSLKLVYYNPDYMHSSQPLPEPEAIPSIFDIY